MGQSFFLYINHGAIKINYVTTVVSINSDNNENITIVHNFHKKRSLFDLLKQLTFEVLHTSMSDINNDTPSPILSSLIKPTWLYPSILYASNLVLWSLLLMYDTKMFRLAGMLLILTCIIEKPSIFTLFSEHIYRKFLQYSDNCPGSYGTQVDLNILLGSSWPWHSSILSLSPRFNSNGSNISESWYLLNKSRHRELFEKFLIVDWNSNSSSIWMKANKLSLYSLQYQGVLW